jgi:glycosyltransferase involved in cell wall biosynthesis
MRPGKKIVYEAHNVYYFISDKIKNPRVEVDSLRLADAIIATSSGIKRDLVRMGVDEGKISVVSNGVNIDKFSIDFDRRGFRKNADISEKGPVIIYSGSWEKWKGLDVLIKAYARVSEKIADCKLILVGGSKEQIGRASKLIRDLNIDTQRIRMVSFLSQKEVVNYLKMADIGIIPTRDTIVGRRYTSPLKLFEYMAAGLAIVASDLPSIREILGEEDAVFFEPGNEHDLADKVIELISNKSKRDRLQVSVRERVSEFSYEERCRKVLETIEGII